MTMTSKHNPPFMAYNLTTQGQNVELYIYDVIGDDGWGNGVTAKQFASDIAAVGNVDEITVRINSMGGAVYDALAIYNILSTHKANVTVKVEGMALSAASVIAMAGDTIQVAENASMMIHDPWGVAIGSAEDMLSEAALLEKIGDSLADTYASRTKKKKDDVRKMMRDETWMIGQEAVDMGFADEVIPAKRIAASVDPSAYLKIPERVLQCISVKKDVPMPNTTDEVKTMDANEFAKLAEKNPEWVAKYIESGKRAGMADGRTEAKAELNALIEASGGDLKLAVESFNSGKDVEDVKAIVADRAIQAKAHADQIAKLEAEKAKLQAQIAAPGSAPVEVKPNPSAAANPKWDGKTPLNLSTVLKNK